MSLPRFHRDVDAVVFAIRRGDVEAVNDLTASSSHCLVRENKDGWLPLHHAAFCGQAECLKAILRGNNIQNIWLLGCFVFSFCFSFSSPSRFNRQADAAGANSTAARCVM